MNVSFPDETRFVYAQLHGDWIVDEFPPLVGRILRECEERSKDLLLVDFLPLSFDRVSTFDRYRMGIGAARLVNQVRRLAALVPSNHADPERFGERVARNRGLDVKVFTEMEGARGWLLDRKRR
jgi:hypothetical protein